MSVGRIDNSTAQHSTAQHSTAQHSTGNHCLNIPEKKILLITIYDNGNYGNILQRYALTRIIESLGFEVHNLCYSYNNSKYNKFFRPAIMLCKKLIKKFIVFIGIKNNKLYLISRLSAFTAKYINNKIFMSYDEALNVDKSLWDKYNFAVTGSDQVWHNWSHTPEESAYYYLEFMPREKRVCYAPSFGFSQFPESDYELHKKGLEGFNKLSCREQEGVNLIKQIINKDAQLVLDPTLLLNASQWQELEKRPDINLPEHYALQFFLGDIKPEYEQAIKQAAGDLPIVNLYNYMNPDLPGYTAEVEEFLYLFNHADLIFTDSFHGTAFSVNFGRNFLVFRRSHDWTKDMFGRIESILASTNLTDHIYTPGMSTRPAEINYNEVNEKLNILRESSLKYLRGCLHV